MKKKTNMIQKAKKAGLPAQTVYNRLHSGWSEKKALSVPNGSYRKTAPYKVEPKKEQTPRSVGKKPIVPLPIEKYSSPRKSKGMYLALGVVALVLVVAIAQN